MDHSDSDLSDRSHPVRPDVGIHIDLRPVRMGLECRGIVKYPTYNNLLDTS